MHARVHVHISHTDNELYVIYNCPGRWKAPRPNDSRFGIRGQTGSRARISNEKHNCIWAPPKTIRSLDERKYLTGTEWDLTETPLFPGMMYATVSRSKSSPCSHFGLLFPTCHHLALEPIASERFYLRAHPVVVFSLFQFHFSSVFLPWYSCCFFQACFPSFTTFKSWQTKHEAFSSFTVHLIFPCWHHAFQHTDRPTRLAFSLYAFSDARALAW